ncbi:hypothetical protein GCM10011320_55900 [Neoroseomonas lacus]|uniref:Uncharacterized protein n=1 Tax=Neoroseomonas lacus TaxID=287609 RepID=A0A917NYK7_9PROT|nr:hypothetical protein GCM10011320_55900 [Neoroseomonas lacus]
MRARTAPRLARMMRHEPGHLARRPLGDAWAGHMVADGDQIGEVSDGDPGKSEIVFRGRD